MPLKVVRQVNKGDFSWFSFFLNNQWHLVDVTFRRVRRLVEKQWLGNFDRMSYLTVFFDQMSYSAKCRIDQKSYATNCRIGEMVFEELSCTPNKQSVWISYLCNTYSRLNHVNVCALFALQVQNGLRIRYISSMIALHFMCTRVLDWGATHRSKVAHL